MTEVLARPDELEPRGGMDPGIREGEGRVRTEREALGLVDVRQRFAPCVMEVAPMLGVLA